MATDEKQSGVAALLAIAPEQWAKLTESFKLIGEAFNLALGAAAETCAKIIAGLAHVYIYSDAMLAAACDNPKHWHLYKHSKKLRVRKKYRNELKRLVDEKRNNQT